MCNSYNNSWCDNNNMWWLIIILAIVLIWCCCGNNAGAVRPTPCNPCIPHDDCCSGGCNPCR